MSETEEIRMTELKPCPFCGGESEVKNRYVKGVANVKAYWCECHQCKVSQRVHFSTTKKAIEAWNRRIE